MATASLTISDISSSSCSYTATFTNYVGFGFFSITQGGTTYASGLFSGTIATGTITGLSPSTSYTMLLTCADDLGSYYDSKSFTTSAQGPTRPSYFAWDYTKNSGYDCYLTATEWNKLTANINAVRTYKGFSSYGFSTAYYNMYVYAYIFNEVLNAINAMASVGVSSKNTGDFIYAYHLNLLVSTLNGIT